MQRSKQDGFLLPSADTPCYCMGRCDTAILTTCLRTRRALCALDLLLKQVETGNSNACGFFQEALAAEDIYILSLLVVGAKHRSPTAFRFLYEHYWPPIFTHIALMIGGNRRYCQRTHPGDLPKAWKELPKTNEETPRTFKAWLYKIANNIAHDYFRQPSQSRSVPVSLEDEIPGRQPPSIEGPENMICETELVKEALSQVKPRYREALWLEAFSNGTQAEKARHLHIREGTFSGYVHRGREELEAAYKRLAEEIQKGEAHD